jgi:hypothetical protein
MPIKDALSQTQYTGMLGKQPIHLFAEVHGDGVVSAMYIYDKYNTPIIANGRLRGSILELHEKGSQNKIVATLRFKHFDPKSQEAEGEWVDSVHDKHLPISLKREFVIEDGEQIDAGPVEVIQAEATKDNYFKTIVVKKKGEFSPQVVGVKVFTKRGNSVLQTFDLDVEYRGTDNVSVEDFNFDGLEDFSVFERSYFGPNTGSIYFLRNPKSDSYFKSTFSGVSLEFDSKAKLIHEHNECCGGYSGMNATYKVVDNKMVLIDQQCYKRDSKTRKMKTAACN